MNKKIKIGIIIFLIVFIGGFFVYGQIYYHSEKTATDYLNGTDDVNVSKSSNGLFLDGYGNDTAIIFYPGAKVEYTAYLPLFTDLASQGIDCYLVEMPFNLAFFGSNSADAIISNTNYKHYFMAGHSLGGAMAGNYVNQTDNNITGLIYLSAHIEKEIDVPVLSIRGSNDGVINLESYQKAKLMMNNVTEVMIDGGNHAQFGYYGHQSGDGNATISAENQQNQTESAIMRFIDYCT
ncbi:alpha/beta hydrolase [Methanobrevibacter sp.]|uniref:alpha/beta hydrolase n=1 Tax=Methanobrevibacter sp. TaxID=66852 RepID=UPI0038909979